MSPGHGCCSTLGIWRRLVTVSTNSSPAGRPAMTKGCGSVAEYWNRYLRQQQSNEQRHRYDPQLVEYRWMIEEFRVSLFAQPLGTAIKISPQRLDKQWAQVERRGRAVHRRQTHCAF